MARLCRSVIPGWGIVADGDGKVSYEEYKASKEKGHERQFKKMDSNGDGYIDAAEKQAQKDKMKAMRDKRKQKAQ